MSEEFRTIHDLIAAQCEARHSACAMVTPSGQDVSFTELDSHIVRLMRQLAGLGVRRGDRVAVVLPTGPEFGVVFLATTSVATCAPLNPGYTRDEFDFYLRDVNASLLILPVGMNCVAEAVAEALEIPVARLQMADERGAMCPSLQGAPETAPTMALLEDVALVLHTSGTTSRPKIVPLSHRNITASVADVARVTELTEADRCLHAMPMFHIGGLIDLTLTPLAVGGVVLYSGAFTSDAFFASLSDLKPTWFQCVPTMLQEILDTAPKTVSSHSLRLIRSVAAALPEETRTAVVDLFGVPVIETFGMTEAAPLITSTTVTDRRVGSVGRSVRPEICIFGPDGQVLPADEIGEIALRGINVITAYENNPAANAVGFRDGWFLTGDLGFLDSDGYLYLRGRSKEVINRGGQKVSPSEVDAALMGHPGVHQVASFALPHKTLGEEVAVFVVAKSGVELEAEEVGRFAEGVLANYKVPRVIRVVDAIPKGPIGKMQRHKMPGVLATDATTASQGEDSAILLAVLEESQVILKEQDVQGADNFFALGGNSLLAVRLCDALSKRVGRQVPATLVFRTQSLARLAAAILAGDFDEGRAVVQLQGPKVSAGAVALPALFSINTTGDYTRLAPYLDPGRPVYNANIFGLTHHFAGSVSKLSIENLAVPIAAELQTINSGGICHILAFCQDGPLAVEVARQIVAAGHSPPHICLIDSFFQPLTGTPGHVLRNAIMLGIPYIRTKLREWFPRQSAGKKFVEMSPEERLVLMPKMQLDRELYKRYVELFTDYRPQPYEGPVSLLVSQEWGKADFSHVYRLAGDALDLRMLKGLHSNLFDVPRISDLGQALEDAMRAVSQS